ncbi:hypothetical protein ACWDTQ_22895 [Streptomyces cellulosae]|uniref:Uncharacterized protein n=1 Tax=Streptomyces cellulosae TaxID=1968 RepID=A0ABW6JIM8_STRCE
MTENTSTQPENESSRRLTREEIAARAAQPVDESVKRRAERIQQVEQLAAEARTRMDAARDALNAMLSVTATVLPEFSVPDGVGTEDTQPSRQETEDLLRMLGIVSDTMNRAGETVEKLRSESFLPLGVRVATSSVRWGHVGATSKVLGISRTHLARLIEATHPDFLATVAPDKGSRRGRIGAPKKD